MNPFDGVTAGSDSAPAVVDWDGDANLDLILGALDGTLWVLFEYSWCEAGTTSKYSFVLGFSRCCYVHFFPKNKLNFYSHVPKFLVERTISFI